jgi:hypothetical protein
MGGAFGELLGLSVPEWLKGTSEHLHSRHDNSDLERFLRWSETGSKIGRNPLAHFQLLFEKPWHPSGMRLIFWYGYYQNATQFAGS